MSSFSLWRMSIESKVFIGFANDARWHTRRLAFAAWVIFTPQGHLLSSRGICLGDTTKNSIEYSAVLELLRNTLLHGISHIWVYLGAQLVVSQLSGVYHIYDPTLHRRFLRVHLLE
jgi:ribonuclease HI